MSFGIWELIIVLVIVAVIFGTTKLKTLGKDVGEGVKGFKEAINTSQDESKEEEPKEEKKNPNMFDIGLPELILLSLVCIVALGPERIPEVVKFLTRFLNKVKSFFNETKIELEKEVGLDEIKREIHNEEIMRKDKE